MYIKNGILKIDPEIKLEILIKLAFGLSAETLEQEYEIPKTKITNLRKNNYVKYNEFFEYWKIDKEIAVLGLTPKYERALDIVHKFYKNKIKIVDVSNIYYKGKFCTLEDILDMADKILQLDNIYGFKECSVHIKNYYK